MSVTWPARALAGTLPRRNASRAEAEAVLTASEKFELPAEQGDASHEYLDRALQGATIMPRPFWFVVPTGPAGGERPYMKTDPQEAARAKDPWTGIELDGQIERQWLFATILEIYNFRLGPVKVCALPVNASGRRLQLLSPQQVLRQGSRHFHKWLSNAAAIWQERKKDSDAQDVELYEYLDNHRNLTRQRPGGTRLIYGAKGTHVRAAVLNHQEVVASIEAPQVQGFVLDQNFYEIEVGGAAEAHYLAAVLNTSLVNEAIKSVQTQGAWGGGRDIHRRPFEMMAIPKFDSDQATHRELAELSRQAHARLAALPARRTREAQLVPVSELLARSEELAREICHAAVSEL